MSLPTVPWEPGPTPITLLDQKLGSHLISTLRAPDGTITIAISGDAKDYFDLADEDWHPAGKYDIFTRTFDSEGGLATYVNERMVR